MSKVKRPEFIEYFLKSRLKRVPTDVLREFVLSLMQKEQHDEIKKYFQQELIEKIFFYYELSREKEEFILAFNQFIRDYLFSAKESIYLIQITNQEAVLNWINLWSNNKYIGQRFHFSKHTHILLQERFLSIGGDTISFPSDVILLVANSTTPKVIPSGLELVQFLPTVEIELIFRKGTNLMEARGELAIILDFVNSAILDSNNPLSLARSLFIGDFEESKLKSITKNTSKIINIDTLKTAIKGSYESISAPVQGDKTSRIQADFQNLTELDEETDPLIKPLLTNLIKDQDRSRISFIYNNLKYSFTVTKRGGLTFRRYAPEEVVTYIVSTVNKI